MKHEEIEEIAERLSPAEAGLKEALNNFFEHRISEPQLAEAIYAFNERVDAEMPRLARAAGLDLDDLRARAAPRDDFHAFFEGRPSDFLQNSARGRRLEPPDWAIGQDLRTRSITTRVPAAPHLAQSALENEEVRQTLPEPKQPEIGLSL